MESWFVWLRPPNGTVQQLKDKKLSLSFAVPLVLVAFFGLCAFAVMGATRQWLRRKEANKKSNQQINKQFNFSLSSSLPFSRLKRKEVGMVEGAACCFFNKDIPTLSVRLAGRQREKSNKPAALPSIFFSLTDEKKRLIGRVGFLLRSSFILSLSSFNHQLSTDWLLKKDKNEPIKTKIEEI